MNGVSRSSWLSGQLQSSRGRKLPSVNRPVPWYRNDSHPFITFQTIVGEKAAIASSAARYGSLRRSHARWSGLKTRKTSAPTPRKTPWYFPSIERPRKIPAGYHHAGEPPPRACASAQRVAHQKRSIGESHSASAPYAKVRGASPARKAARRAVGSS